MQFLHYVVLDSGYGPTSIEIELVVVLSTMVAHIIAFRKKRDALKYFFLLYDLINQCYLNISKYWKPEQRVAGMIQWDVDIVMFLYWITPVQNL